MEPRLPHVSGMRMATGVENLADTRGRGTRGGGRAGVAVPYGFTRSSTAGEW